MAVEGILHGKNILDQTVTERKLAFEIIEEIHRIPYVIDNLTSQDRVNALSAYQGYVLDQTKADRATTYTKVETNDLLATKVDKVPGKGLSTNDLTNELLVKLQEIQSGAQVNQDAYSYVVVNGSTLTALEEKDTLRINQGTNIAISANTQNKTITIAGNYPLASSTGDGLMSASDKDKLNSIQAGGEVNQNAFSYVSAGGGTATANAKTATLTVVGSGATSVSASGTTLTISSVNTTYGLATTSANGLMSAADKVKLNGITAGAAPNQNAFSIVSTPLGAGAAATTPTDTLSLVAGDGISILGSGKTINIAATGSYVPQNLYGVINVNDQINFSADNVKDTFRLAAGPGISIVPTPGVSKSATFSSAPTVIPCDRRTTDAFPGGDAITFTLPTDYVIDRLNYRANYLFLLSFTIDLSGEALGFVSNRVTRGLLWFSTGEVMNNLFVESIIDTDPTTAGRILPVAIYPRGTKQFTTEDAGTVQGIVFSQFKLGFSEYGVEQYNGTNILNAIHTSAYQLLYAYKVS